VLASISLCSWGGLIWVMYGTPAPAQGSVATKMPVKTVTFEVSAPSPANSPTPTSIPDIGSITIGEDGANLVYVPEGEFTMGSNMDVNEQPIHMVRLDAFWIDQTEVTNKLFSYHLNKSGKTKRT